MCRLESPPRLLNDTNHRVRKCNDIIICELKFKLSLYFGHFGMCFFESTTKVEPHLFRSEPAYQVRIA